MAPRKTAVDHLNSLLASETSLKCYLNHLIFKMFDWRIELYIFLNKRVKGVS